MADYPLGSLGIQIREHWKRHCPQMYAELEKSGHLDESVSAAQEQTSDLMYELQNGPRKLDYHQAWELAREEWAFLPSEEAVPDLRPIKSSRRASS
jgi:hypothetical protein